MEAVREYSADGAVLRIPLRYDEKTGMYLEDYSAFLESPVVTPSGYPVMLCVEDACDQAEPAESGDCGSCRFYRRLGEHTWIGVCRHSR